MQQLINAIVIDDKSEDVLAVTGALASKGISTLPIHFTDVEAARKLCTVASETVPRVIITDIQMTGGDATPSKTDMSNVAGCISDIVAKNIGPYIILAWTSKSASFDTLKERVEEVLNTREQIHPFYFGSIDKNECRDEVGNYDANTIFFKVREHLENQQQIRALMFWEGAVLQAAKETVNVFGNLPQEELRSNLFSLAQSVAGKNLSGFEATAINEAFSYILKDKLGQLAISSSLQKHWAGALVGGDKSPIDEVARHRLNTLLHIEDLPTSDIICPGDVWCTEDPSTIFKMISIEKEEKKQTNIFMESLVSYSDDQKNLDSKRKTASGERRKTLRNQLKQEFETPRSQLKNKMKVVAIEISPTCDFSNQKKPLKTFLAGALVPVSELLPINGSDALVKCRIRWEENEWFLVFSAKYMFSMTEAHIAREDSGFQKIFRVRESLLQSWVHSISAYNSRIGTASF
ncbi:MAG: hypothetical protein P1U50_10985 [Parvibaculaceae bacterium]|nr:hypothetical protein [Parvibaculaceae bacterium]